jgi:hypothetical protein
MLIRTWTVFYGLLGFGFSTDQGFGKLLVLQGHYGRLFSKELDRLVFYGSGFFGFGFSGFGITAVFRTWTLDRFFGFGLLQSGLQSG